MGVTDTTQPGLSSPAWCPEDSCDSPQQDVSTGQAENAFSKSVAVSAIRCTLTYVLIPFVFPLLGFGAGVGPYIGVPIGLAAIVANIVSIRRFHRSDHRLKWPMSMINAGILVLLVILVVIDFRDLLS